MTTRVFVFCEGQTEETFVRNVLYSHFLSMNIFLYPINLRGISTYGKVKREIERKCKEDSLAWVTTLIDFYRFPQDFPGLTLNESFLSYNKAPLVVQAFQDDIKYSNFIAHLMSMNLRLYYLVHQLHLEIGLMKKMLLANYKKFAMKKDPLNILMIAWIRHRQNVSIIFAKSIKSRYMAL